MAKNIDISCAVAFLTQNQTNIGSRWKMWKKTFDVYLIAASGTRKNALLLHCGGEEVQEIYNTLPTSHHITSQTTNHLTTYKI